jgi:hypothetical protein
MEEIIVRFTFHRIPLQHWMYLRVLESSRVDVSQDDQKRAWWDGRNDKSLNGTKLKWQNCYNFTAQ